MGSFPMPQSGGSGRMPPIGPTQPMPGQGGAGGAGGFDPSMLPGVMQSMQETQMALQKLAQGLPPLSSFIAQFLSQLGQAVPAIIMAAGGGQPSPGGPPAMGDPSAPGGGPQGMGAGVGAPPMPPG